MEVHQAILIHSQLSDRYASTELGLLYLGKDYSTFPMFYGYEKLPKHSESFILEIIQCIDAHAVRKASKAHKKAADKIRAKNRSK